MLTSQQRFFLRGMDLCFRALIPPPPLTSPPPLPVEHLCPLGVDMVHLLLENLIKVAHDGRLVGRLSRFRHYHLNGGGDRGAEDSHSVPVRPARPCRNPCISPCRSSCRSHIPPSPSPLSFSPPLPCPAAGRVRRTQRPLVEEFVCHHLELVPAQCPRPRWP